VIPVLSTILAYGTQSSTGLRLGTGATGASGSAAAKRPTPTTTLSQNAPSQEGSLAQLIKLPRGGHAAIILNGLSASAQHELEEKTSRD